MPIVTTRGGATIFCKDWGIGRPVVFSHGWPLDADVWDPQLLLMASNGFRAVAHDRRGHGRSCQSWDGNTMDDYADDLAAVIEALDLRDVVLVGHSTGGGEVVRYVARHGSERISKMVLVAAVPPLMLKTAGNPAGTPMEVFDDLRRVGVSILTIGQYLRPTPAHAPMMRYYHPEEFVELKRLALERGFVHVESGPLVRSSYHAHEQADAFERSTRDLRE